MALVAGAPLVRADAAARVDLRLGLSRREDTQVAGGTRVTAAGTALSDLHLGGVWFAPFAGPRALGLAAGLGLERFTLHAAPGAPAIAPGEVAGSGFEARAGLAFGGGWGGLRLEGTLGYGGYQLPVVQVTPGVGAVGLAGSGVRAHGPALGARVALGLPAGFGLELAGEAWPLGFGASHGGVAVDPRRFGLRAGVSYGQLAVGAVRLAAVLSAELARASARGDDVDLGQTRRQLALGVRATWPEANAASVRIAPAEAAVRRPPATTEPAPTPPPSSPPATTAPSPSAPVPSIITGVVRDEAGRPLAARIHLPERDATAVTDAQGAFALTVPPGRYTLVITASGFRAQTKHVDALAGEQTIFNVDLHGEAP